MRAVVTIKFTLTVSGKSREEIERKALEAAREHPEEVAEAVAGSGEVVKIET